MSLVRALLLKGSQSPRLRELAVRRQFVRRAVRRFMPGEDLASALQAAATLHQHGLSAVLTLLGENLTTRDEIERVAAHYLDALEQIKARRLDAQISIKLTQLGLDLDVHRTETSLRRIVGRARQLENIVWVDMESSRYVDVTLDMYQRVRRDLPNVGVCVQAYLYRTAQDVAALIEAGASIRLVKGAYREPASIAIPRKRDVDSNYLALARQILGSGTQTRGGRFGVATHDRAIIREIEGLADGATRDWVEFQMLYGIQRELQRRLARDGHGVRVLISYGEAWFPWYMRRLAERPANMWFVVRHLLG